MSAPLAGHVALVTGAGAGIGRAEAEVLAERGARVIAQDIAPGRAAETARAIRDAGGVAELLECDAADVSAMRAHLGGLERRLGHIDILVNNAGISGRGTGFEAVDEASFDRMMAVHVKSAFFCAQILVAGMKARRWGRIINTSSMFAMKGSPNMAHYTAAKGALLGLTKALARELGPWNITVNAVAPGLVRTAMTLASFGDDEAEFERRAALVPMRRLAAPRDIALAVAFLASDDAALLTGQTISPSGGDAIVGL